MAVKPSRQVLPNCGTITGILRGCLQGCTQENWMDQHTPCALVFDIETVPDVAFIRARYDWDHLDDQEVYQAIVQQYPNGFLSLPYHQVVAISAVWHTPDRVHVWSLGDCQTGEAELIARFFEGITQHVPVLVSWNGAGFDLPVLHYRALKHQIACPRYWEMGEVDSPFKWNNYINRFHFRHIDLMDVLSGYQSRAVAKLDLVAELMGFPGKLGMDGSQVWGAYCRGELARIRAYCETDVLNTYLIYLGFEHMRGRISAEAQKAYHARLRMVLSRAQTVHGLEFLAAWEATSQRMQTGAAPCGGEGAGPDERLMSDIPPTPL